MSEFLQGHHFQVEWGGTRIGFQEISGLRVKVDVVEVHDGSFVDESPIKLPGRKHFGNITLRRGIVKRDNEFFDWWNTIQFGEVERRDIVISLLNEEHIPTLVWKIRNAFPVEIVWSDLRASQSEIAIESLEIACEGITVSNE